MDDNNITTPELLQSELKTIRLYMDFSTQELAEYLGVTRQTINNLESGKTRLSDTQVIALFAIIDRRLSHDSIEYTAVKKLIREPSCGSTDSPSLLDLWFDCLELKVKDNSVNLPSEDVNAELTEGSIFVMFDFLMEESAIEVLKALAPRLLQVGQQIILPRVHATKLIETSEHGDAAQAEQAQKVMDYFVQLNADNLMQIRGKESDTFESDNDLIEYILSRYSDRGRIVILKQNVSEIKLSTDTSTKCSFYNINSLGVLEEYSYPTEKLNFYKLLDDAVEDDL